MMYALILETDQDLSWVDVTLHDTKEAGVAYLKRHLIAELTENQPVAMEEFGALIEEIAQKVDETGDYTKFGFRYRLSDARKIETIFDECPNCGADRSSIVTIQDACCDGEIRRRNEETAS